MNQQTLGNHDRTSTSNFTSSFHGTFHHGDTLDAGPEPTEDYLWVSSFNPNLIVSNDSLAGIAEQQQAAFRLGLDEQPPREFDARLNDFSDSFCLFGNLGQKFPQESRWSTAFMPISRPAEQHFDAATIHTTTINPFRHTGDPDVDAWTNRAKST